jgi:hypothetical protein
VRHLVLERERATVQHHLLELAVRRVQQRAARRLVHAARLHADHAVLDDVRAADAVHAADLVQHSTSSSGDSASPSTVTG